MDAEVRKKIINIVTYTLYYCLDLFSMWLKVNNVALVVVVKYNTVHFLKVYQENILQLLLELPVNS